MFKRCKMKYCKFCKVELNSDEDKCVLCGNEVRPVANKKSLEVFPEIPPSFESNNILKIPLFISVTIVIISFLVNMIFPSEIEWFKLMILALISLWIGLYTIFFKRYNFHKKIIRQVIILSLLALFWDWQTGWRAWSISYFLPIIFISAILLMYLSGKIMKLGISSYISYALIAGVLGILPALFILFDWVRNPNLSAISAGFSLIFLSAIFIFKGNEMKEELSKKMHI